MNNYPHSLSFKKHFSSVLLLFLFSQIFLQASNEQNIKRNHNPDVCV